MPGNPAEERRAAEEIKLMVGREMPHQPDDWQSLHALTQLEGEDMRRGGSNRDFPGGNVEPRTPNDGIEFGGRRLNNDLHENCPESNRAVGRREAARGIFLDR